MVVFLLEMTNPDTMEDFGTVNDFLNQFIILLSNPIPLWPADLVNVDRRNLFCSSSWSFDRSNLPAGFGAILFSFNAYAVYSTPSGGRFNALSTRPKI